MAKKVMISLTLLLMVLLVVPVRAEFYGMSDFDVKYTEDANVDPPQY